ncbi:MAG: hypothetical protein J7J89_04300 [Thermoplasmata archaeon]|nr:hypothetical protein [Thermoplasmata archaeon]
MDENADYLRKFAGEWVLVLKDEVIMHGKNLEEILEEAKEYPDEDLTLLRVPPQKTIFR